MAESSSSARATRGGGLQQIRVGPKVGTVYVVNTPTLPGHFILPTQTQSVTDCDSFLAIGGVGTTPPEHWTNSKGQLWLGTIDDESAPDIGILSFPNRLAANGVLTGRDVEEEGASLLSELHRLAEDEAVIKLCNRWRSRKLITSRLFDRRLCWWLIA